jgi:S-formylglutathione hydrolase FrmB
VVIDFTGYHPGFRNIKQLVMKNFLLIVAALFVASATSGQFNKIDTSFYSVSLDETKLVDVYFPPGYEDHPDWYYPVIYCLPAWLSNQNEMGSYYLSSLQSHINDGLIDPVIMVCANNNPPPFQGNMYVNSEIWGNYEDYNVYDLVEWVESSFRAIPERNARALIGHSMGAYGAFRYGILHKEKFRALAGHAGIVTVDKNLWLDTARHQVIIEHPAGPPYYYNYSTNGYFTKGTFLLSGAFSPDTNSTQTYITPQVVNFLFDENADYIDSVYQKWLEFDISQLIQQLTPEDSVGIFFGCGVNDDFLLYPANLALTDTLEMLGLPYEFYSHNGGHNMPSGFRNRAYIFLDSLLMPPGPYTRINELADKYLQLNLVNYPNPVTHSATIQFELPYNAFTELSVFNHLGQLVIVLIKDKLGTGNHHVNLDFSLYPPGIYFIRLQAGEQVVVKKAVKI